MQLQNIDLIMEFESLKQELTLSTEMIRSLLAGIEDEQARVKPDADNWSILEVVCHLYDEEREDFREHLDFILHRQSEAWHRIDPKGWVSQRHYNNQDIQGMKEKFFEERMISLAWLNGLHNADFNLVYKSQWGEMSAGNMFASWVAHDYLHIRQLVELRRNRIDRITQPYNIGYAGDW
jgi:hypothetical protein